MEGSGPAVDGAERREARPQRMSGVKGAVPQGERRSWALEFVAAVDHAAPMEGPPLRKKLALRRSSSIGRLEHPVRGQLERP